MPANEWERRIEVMRLDKCRTGWAGVWDAIKQAVTGEPRLVVPYNMTISLYVKIPDGGTFSVTGFSIGDDDA